MEESDVREIFSPFGEIVQMDIMQDEITRTNRGYAYIEYKTAKVQNSFKIGHFSNSVLILIAVVVCSIPDSFDLNVYH